MKVGDVVVLKSGGPRMTVNRIRTVFRSQSISCTWFTKDRKVEAAFDLEALEKEVSKTDNAGS
jgi:uncharacterized protein YodC (DUF2158 family)